MKLVLIQFGKTKDKGLTDLIEKFRIRTNRYCSLEVLELRDARLPKTATPLMFKEVESESLRKVLRPSDYLILLDEGGKSYTSRKFATFLKETYLRSKGNRILFVIGGAYGFSEEIYRLANAKVSLSSMTFSHQLIRLIFMEQLYRAFTILNKHPYHND